MNSAKFSSDYYLLLENYFRRIGKYDLADSTYIMMKDREKSNASNWLYKKVVGYGLEPLKAFIWCIPFIIIGCLVFRKKKMTPESENDNKYYNVFYYSVALLLPLIQLRIKNKWSPNPINRFTYLYSILHQIIGWILISWGVLGVTGLIK